MIRRTLSRLLCGVALGGALFATSVPAEAAPRTVSVRLKDINKPLVPTRKIRGDREFGGGPQVNTRVELKISKNRRRIEAHVWFRAEERKDDRSTVDETFVVPVYDAPKGQVVTKILGERVATASFKGKNAGLQILVPGTDVAKFFREFTKLANRVWDAKMLLMGKPPRTKAGRKKWNAAKRLLKQLDMGKAGSVFQKNHVHMRTPKRGPVKLMAIVADTGGDDISHDRNGKDDCRIVAIDLVDRIKVKLDKAPRSAGMRAPNRGRNSRNQRNQRRGK
jgi:hypothetical protein